MCNCLSIQEGLGAVGQVLTVESDFQSGEFIRLSINDRIRKCRAMAREAEDLAALADRDVREVYMDLAQQWLALAHEIEDSQRLPV